MVSRSNFCYSETSFIGLLCRCRSLIARLVGGPLLRRSGAEFASGACWVNVYIQMENPLDDPREFHNVENAADFGDVGLGPFSLLGMHAAYHVSTISEMTCCVRPTGT